MERPGRDGGCTRSLHETQRVPGDATSDPIGPQLMGRSDSCTAPSSSWQTPCCRELRMLNACTASVLLQGPISRGTLPGPRGAQRGAGQGGLIRETFAQPRPCSRSGCDPFRLQSAACSSPPSQPQEGDTQAFWGHSIPLSPPPSSSPLSIRSESPSGSTRQGLGRDEGGSPAATPPRHQKSQQKP